MQVKKLGSQNIMASQLGLGCMGMSEFCGYGFAYYNKQVPPVVLCGICGMGCSAYLFICLVILFLVWAF